MCSYTQLLHRVIRPDILPLRILDADGREPVFAEIHCTPEQYDQLNQWLSAAVTFRPHPYAPGLARRLGHAIRHWRTQPKPRQA